MADMSGDCVIEEADGTDVDRPLDVSVYTIYYNC